MAPTVAEGRGAPRMGRLLYAGYVWLLLGLVGVVVWPFVALMPDRHVNWRLTRAAALLLARLSGVTVSIVGALPDGAAPSVIVGNHASFVDGIVPILLSREPVVIVAGGELEHQRLAGPFLRGLGCEFVRSTDDGGERNAERFARVLAGGSSLAIFPEASLSREPGLRRFHLGAFVMAVEAGVPVLPIGIRGSREIVRPGRRFPEPGHLGVHVGQPISPRGSGVRAAIDLRNRARATVLELSGEIDLLVRRT